MNVVYILKIKNYKSVLSTERINKMISTALKNKVKRILLKKYILSDISKIKIRIHRIRLSGPYIWNDLDKKLGKLKLNDNFDSKRMPNYKKQTFAFFEGRRLSIFLCPINGTLPQCMIELSYPGVNFLTKLYKRLPELQVSSAEYTIDLFFDKPEDVKKYFRLLYKYIYFPYRKQFNLESDYLLRDERRYKNAWIFAGKMKMYERGLDKERQKTGYWLLDDVDRIRIEFKANWTDLNKHNLTDLSRFAEDPKFAEMLINKFYFKRFKSSKNNHLPAEYEKYKSRDRKGHNGAFHTQYLHEKKRGNIKNIAQQVENVQELMPLLAAIHSKIERRNKSWRKNYDKLNNIVRIDEDK